jgi:hypothetical protein
MTAPADDQDDFSKSGKNTPDALPRLPAESERPNLKRAERADWTLFRTVEGLQQKAGVPANRLRRLVLKELADNALDADGTIGYGLVDGHPDLYFVEDGGPGLDGEPGGIASLFSISRPLTSSKLLRKPQRGQLGNGLRVVAGAVLASRGVLTVVTRNQRIILRPETDGTTAVTGISVVDHPVGTRVEIGFGPALPYDPDPFAWVRPADAVAAIGANLFRPLVAVPVRRSTVSRTALSLRHGVGSRRGRGIGRLLRRQGW